MKRNPIQSIISTAIIILGFGSVFMLSNFLDNNRVSMPESYQDEDLALQGKRLKGFALGSEGLLADWYWISSLQYIGGKFVNAATETINLDDLRSFNPRLLYPYLDNATDLDPAFMPAYAYGSTILPAIDPKLAIKLTEKGIANNPDAWRLYHYLGYINWRLKDFEKAAAIYDRGSRIEGSPPFMKLMAAAMRTQGGSRETARAIYKQMLDETQDQQTRSNAEFRLMEIESLEEQDVVNTLLQDNKDKSNRCISRIAELIPQLRSVSLPDHKDFRIDAANNLVDPSGTPYLFDDQKCEIRVDFVHSRIPIPL